jgi:hypothetical protein
VLVGVAGFDPAFPGSPLFRVVDVDVARPLLAALAPRARPGDDALRVYVEGQPALRDALVGVGGDVVMRVLRLEGRMPCFSTVSSMRRHASAAVSFSATIQPTTARLKMSMTT